MVLAMVLLGSWRYLVPGIVQLAVSPARWRPYAPIAGSPTPPRPIPHVCVPHVCVPRHSCVLRHFLAAHALAGSGVAVAVSPCTRPIPWLCPLPSGTPSCSAGCVPMYPGCVSGTLWACPRYPLPCPPAFVCVPRRLVSGICLCPPTSVSPDVCVPPGVPRRLRRLSECVLGIGGVCCVRRGDYDLGSEFGAGLHGYRYESWSSRMIYRIQSLVLALAANYAIVSVAMSELPQSRDPGQSKHVPAQTQQGALEAQQNAVPNKESELPSKAQDESFDWVKVTANAAWQPRDSSGEAVFGGKLWILGGWFDSFSSPPRDVWNSSDGVVWEQKAAQAPWRYSDLPMTVAFDDRLWIMGGWTNGRLAGHGATNEVWSSADGSQWKLETQAAQWTPRLAAGAVVFRGRMWILGGTENYYFGDSTCLKNDVWSSADGRSWKRELANAPWSPRAYFQALVHDDKLWVVGGGNYVPEYRAHNDVWCSEDGIAWKLVTENAAWSPRLWFSTATYRGHMWVLGGWSNNPSRNWGDAWYSRDGKDWSELSSNVVWKARHEHSTYVFQDKIWVAGGHAQPLSNEVWSLTLPSDFNR